MRWVIGFDLTARDAGARTFAKWTQTGPGRDGHTYLGVHAVEDPRCLGNDADSRAVLESGARDATQKALAEVGIDATKGEIGLILDSAADLALGRAAGSFAADAIVIGRRARTGEDLVVRLGRTARRLLRNLPAAVIVAPPELEAVGAGPVLLAIDVEQPPPNAAHFARRAARELGRPLRLAHVARDPFSTSKCYVPASYLPGMYEEHRARQRARTEEFVRSQGLHDVELDIEEGEVTSKLIDIARRDDACMIVCASRELPARARLFSSSVGSQLAASAPVPVAVVPAT